MGTRSSGVLWAAVFLAVGAGNVQADAVWSIGQVDGSYSEFAMAGKFDQYTARFASDPVLAIGRGPEAKGWPYVHPGPADAWAGARTHPFRIEFNLGAVNSGAYRLAVHAANTHSGFPPQLQVKINDAPDWIFAFQPGADDRSLADPKIGHRQTQSFLFPGTLLHAGHNVITLTISQGSWLLYDAVTLETTDIRGAHVDEVEAACTPLFAGADPNLKQAVRVIVQNTGIDGDAVIAVADSPDSTKKVHLRQGANNVCLLVPPYTQAAPHRVTVQVAGKTMEAAFEGRPERHWKIYVAPSTHTDIGYTDLQEKIFVRHQENTAAALKACESNSGFRWNLEVFAQLDWYRQRGPEAYAELDRRITEGRVGLTGMYLNMLTGLCTGEEMVKVLAPAQDFAAAHNVPVTVGTVTDVPSMAGTLPMFLKQAGVKYFADGINHDRGPVWDHADARMVQSPFWWEALDGSRVMAVFTKSYGQAQVMGLRDSVDVLEAKLPGWIKAIDRPDYPGDAIYGNGAFWDNELVTPHFIEVADEWNKAWTYPQIIVSCAAEFFEYVEQNFGAALPVFRGDMGAYWEDGAASSALETGVVRLAKARLNTAARWHALAAAHSAKWEYPSAALAEAWNDAIYYDEHTWGAYCSISEPKRDLTVQQWAYKAAYAQRAQKEADDLALHSGKAAFEALTGTREQSGGRTVTVSNECSWTRDIVASVDGVYSVRDSVTGKTAPSYQVGGGTLFTALGVPGMGYRRYKLGSKKAEKASAGLLRSGADAYTWESPRFRYRIDLKTGAFTSIEDLKSHREWVDASTGYGVNQFLYVTGGEGTSLVHSAGAKPAALLQPVTHTEASARLEANGPFSAVLHISRKGAGLATVETTCTIHDDGRLDFANVLDKPETTQKEAGYFAFPFKLDKPEAARTFLDLPYGVVEADREQLPGGCREWYSANSFMAVTDGGLAAYVATREAPLFTIGAMNRGVWPGNLDNNHGLVFAYVFNNYWHTNYKASQGGRIPFTLSVKLREEAFDPVAGVRFGAECLAADSVAEFLCKPVNPKKAPGRAQGAFARVSDGPVILAELARDDNGRLLARLYNPSNADATTALEFPGLAIKQARKTDLFGRHEESIAASGRRVSACVPARSIATIAIETAHR
ncbi:MAG: hypothetical protein HZB26_16660 [Candidatus Hydrogenedentes bacterium]|nr:hypothetical protein [Candidatus Hydrogenedentota bacterium]